MKSKMMPAGEITKKLKTRRRINKNGLVSMVIEAARKTEAQVAVEGVPAVIVGGVVTQSGLVRDERKRATWLANHSGVAYSTIQKRFKEQSDFLPTEADRIMTSFRITDLATRLFNGDRNEAMRWMDRPHRLLSGDTPTERAQTSAGAAQVEKLIHRMEYGNAA